MSKTMAEAAEELRAALRKLWATILNTFRRNST